MFAKKEPRGTRVRKKGAQGSPEFTKPVFDQFDLHHTCIFCALLKVS